MKHTENYGLALYESTDRMSITAETDSLNANMKIIDSQLNEMDEQILQNIAISTPIDFKWKDHPLVGHLFRTNNGIECTFDVESLKPSGGTTYYVNPSGSDSNSGLTPDKPLQLIATAINKPDAETVVLQDGVFNVYRVPGTVRKSISLVAADGANPIVMVCEESVGWTKVSGYNNVYSMPKNTYCVYDTVYKIAYKRVKSIDEVESEEATFFSPGDGTTYMHQYHASSSEVSAYRQRCCLSNSNLLCDFQHGETLYLQGIRFVGGNYGAIRVQHNGGDMPKVYAKDCEFISSNSNAIALEGCISIMQGCKAQNAVDDGFNYHDKGGQPKAIEIDCEGFNNGWEGGTDNGSTMHDAGAIIRVNGQYYGNKGPNVADVHITTNSWNLGCIAHHSAYTSNDSQKADFVFSDNEVHAWVDTCSAYGSYYDLYVDGLGGVNVKNCFFTSIHIGNNCYKKSY